MRKSVARALTFTAAALLVPGLVTVSATADTEQARPASAEPVTLGTGGWQVQSTALAKQPGEQVSSPDFATKGWLPVKPDDAGAPGTEITALLQNGECPDVFTGENMRKCFGYMAELGPVTVPRFAVPWWFRTDFTPEIKAGQTAKLTIPGVVGEGDVWVNGKLVAGKDIVSGAYATHTFDVSKLVHPGKNSLAIKMYPNNPKKMFTLDQVDWGQFPPDNNTGIQFPVTLQVSDALTGSNAHVTQANAADLSSSALTVKTDVTNNAGSAQTADVSATVTPPAGGGAPIEVKQSVSVPAHSTKTVEFTPAKFGSLKISKPKLWWPYSMGDQPLYGLKTAIAQNGAVSTTASQTFGIRSVSTRLVGKSPQAPEGSRIFGINGKEFVFRGGGYAPDLFLRYSKAEVAHHVALIKNMGLNGIRLEGHDMPQDFYDQMDRAGILVIGGFLCCDAWQPEGDTKLTERDYRIMHDSAAGIGKLERNHPSVFTYGWSDNEPIPRQESETLKAFKETDFDVPVTASAEYKSTPTLGQAGEKEGPYDWGPPTYWYDTTHFDPKDPSRTNVGGSWGFASEQSAGHTVPTMDSVKRFLSPVEQEKLWKEPEYNQYHANFETGHGGYKFGTLYTFDDAMAKRYGKWSDLDSYVKQAQVANYENTRSQFESFINHSTDKKNPATGIVYWQLNKGWPTLLWSLFNNDGDQPGAYFGAKKANKPLHALYAYDDDTVTVANLGGVAQQGLSVQAKVYDLGGKVLDDQQADGVSLAGQQVRNAVLKPKVPSATKPPAKASVYFVELLVKQNGQVVDRNTYWHSTQKDVVDWPKSYQNPQATMSQYANLQALQSLPKSAVGAKAVTSAEQGPNGADTATSVTVTNTSSKPVAFFLRADLRRGTADGKEQPGDNQVVTATWDENDIVLWPGESQVLTAHYDSKQLRGAQPVVSVAGWNTDRVVVSAPASVHGAPAPQYAAYRMPLPDGTKE